ncbi:F-box-like domain-containing protein [Microdochium nivale]|nr:F-box-like domain-containing protein [Microdochium nivale]
MVSYALRLVGYDIYTIRQGFRRPGFVDLPELPLEILLLIGKYCRETKGVVPDYKMLYRLCLVSRDFYRSFNSELWRTLSLSHLPNPDSMDKLMEVLADHRTSMELRSTIHHIVFRGKLRFSREALFDLDHCRNWITEFYSEEFTNHISKQLTKYLGSEDSLLALLLILTPSVRTFSWERRRGYLAVAALFTYKLCKDARSSPMAHEILENLETFQFANTESMHPLSKRPAKQQPFFLTNGPTKVAVSNVYCVNAGYHYLHNQLNHPLGNLQGSLLIDCTLSMSTFSAPVFDLLLRASPGLRSLVIIDQFFRMPSEDANEIMTIQDMGDSLRAHGGALTKFELRHTVYHPFSYTSYNRGLLGSLRSLARLKSLAIDPELLYTGTAAINPLVPLAGLLPPSLEELFMESRIHVPQDHMEYQVALLARDAEFRDLCRLGLYMGPAMGPATGNRPQIPPPSAVLYDEGEEGEHSRWSLMTFHRKTIQMRATRRDRAGEAWSFDRTRRFVRRGSRP